MRASRRRPRGCHPAPLQPGHPMAGARARLSLRFRGDGHAAHRAVANAYRSAGKQEEAERDGGKAIETYGRVTE